MTVASVPANLRLIGSEMLVWSDDEPGQQRTPAGGAVLAELLTELVRPGGRAFVAGLHDDAILSVLEAEKMQVTCLMRSYPDAAKAAKAHPGVEVLCGDLTKVDPAEPFDLVLVGGGVERLTSADGPHLSWQERAALVAGLVGPGGTLALVHENLLGIHRLTSLVPPRGERTDADWTPSDSFDATRPASARELAAAVTGFGLETSTPLLVFPDPQRPTALVPLDLATDPQLKVHLQAVVATAFDQAYADRPSLMDPRPLASGAMRAEAGTALAAAWLVVATREGQQTLTPRALVSDERAAPWPIRYELMALDGWNRRVLGPRALVSRNGLIRDPQALDGPVPAGIPLLDHLIVLGMHRDVPGLQMALAQLATWAASRADAEGRLTGADLLILPSDLLVVDDTFVRWDPSWSTELRASVEVAVARSLRYFATVLVGGGYSHPWPQLDSVDELTRVLGGLAGYDWGGDVVLRQAVELHAKLTGAELGLSDAEIAELRGRLAGLDQGSTAPGSQNIQDLQAAVDRLRAELAHEKATNAWNEKLLLGREKALRKAESRVELLSGTFTARMGKLGLALARKTIQVAKRVLRRNGEEQEEG
ncbi:hypothetical protein AB0M47_27915 [Hamadaea sp. NPDC051192]|uniref:hypothetical protein n=1 Tax=Hamadaea sp. NPDC051192 TaxID=3154940 RepID=UPI003444DF53